MVGNLKAVALGAIQLLVGLLVTAYGFRHSVFIFFTQLIWIAITGIGLWIFAKKV